MCVIADFIRNSSQTTLTLVIGLFLILIFAFLKNVQKHVYRYRGPWGIPILGYYPFLPKSDYHVRFTNLSKKFGDAYIVKLLGKLYLLINSNKALKEALITKNDCFAERSQDLSLFMEAFKDGIMAMNGEPWRVWRKFLVQSMKEIGLGTKEQLINPMQESIETTLKQMQESGKQPVNITALLLIQCSEVIRRLMLGDDVTDKTVQHINELFRILIAPLSYFESFLPGRIPRILSTYKFEGITEMIRRKKDLDAIFENVIKDHEECFDINNPRDLVDLYIRERDLASKNGDQRVKYFNDKAFIDVIIQIYGDGSYTVGAVVAYFIHVIASKPDIQECIFTEIVENIGIDILPTYEDRMKLPYTNSVIKEMMRKFDFFPLQPTLECTADTTISGTFVPKGTILLINAYGVNNDQSVYKEPEKFDPRRFMLSKDEDEMKDNSPLFFGIGKRSCLGETLVSTELFLFLTAIIQKFKVELSETPKKSELSADSQDGNEDPLQDEYYVIATLRNPRQL